jgi:hypothetical protein
LWSLRLSIGCDSLFCVCRSLSSRFQISGFVCLVCFLRPCPSCCFRRNTATGAATKATACLRDANKGRGTTKHTAEAHYAPTPGEDAKQRPVPAKSSMQPAPLTPFSGHVVRIPLAKCINSLFSWMWLTDAVVMHSASAAHVDVWDCESCTLMLWFARADRQKAITRGIEAAEAWTPGCSAQHRPSDPHHVCGNCIHVETRSKHSYRPQQIGHTNHPPKFNAAPFTRRHTHTMATSFHNRAIYIP